MSPSAVPSPHEKDRGRETRMKQANKHNQALDSAAKGWGSEGMTVKQYRMASNSNHTRIIDRPATCPGCEIYVTETPGQKPTAKAYRGRGCRAEFNYYYSTIDRLEVAVGNWLDDIEKSNQRRADNANRKTILRAIGHGWEVGTILQGSWGHEQTNQVFLQVVESKGNSILVQRIASEIVESTGPMSESVRPIKDAFRGEPFRKTVQFNESGPYLRHSHAYLTPAEPGRVYYCSHYA